MSSSKVLFYFCISFIIGISVESFVKIPQLFVWGFLLLGVGVITVAFLLNKNVVIIFGFCVLFLVVGIMRFQISEFTIGKDVVSVFNDSPKSIELTGVVIGAPDVRASSQKLKVKIDTTQSVVLVTTNLYPEYHYLDEITITGKLKTPAEFEDFSYKNYLLKDGVYSVMDFPTIKIVLTKHVYTPSTFLYEKLLWMKEKIRASILSNFSPPQSSLLEGIMLGGTSTMNQESKSKMSFTGLTHLTAISGSNIVILSSILMSFLLALGLWRGQAFYFTITFTWLYIALAAFPASGIRAAIMASIFLLSQKLGRQNTSSRTIVLAGSLMLLQNPLLLLYDVGFQLSFMASLGIIHIKPLFDHLFMHIKNSYLKGGLDIISITMAAQIVTLPLIAYDFRVVSLVAPITNFLVIPMVDVIMILGIVAIIFGMISHILGLIVAIPCWFLLTYFIKVMDIFYQPWAAIAMPHFYWIWIVLYYIALFFVVRFLQKFLKPKFLGY